MKRNARAARRATWCVGLLCALFTGLAVIAGDLPGVRPSPAGAQGASGNQPAPHGADFAAAQRYVNAFYPRWFTYRQSEKGSASNHRPAHG